MPRDLSQLPDVLRLRRLCQSLAMLDAIIEPDWEMRYHSFDAHWGMDAAMASMRNGSGNEYLVVFNESGALLRGFAHESAMSPYRTEPPRLWPGVLDEVPPVFAPFLAEPTFAISDTTFCIWRTHLQTRW